LNIDRLIFCILNIYIPLFVLFILILASLKEIKYKAFPNERQKEVKSFMKVFAEEYKETARQLYQFIKNNEEFYQNTLKQWEEYKKFVKRDDKRALDDFHSRYGFSKKNWNIKSGIFLEKLIKKPHKLVPESFPDLQAFLDTYKNDISSFMEGSVNETNNINSITSKLEEMYWNKEKEKNSSKWRHRQEEETKEQYSHRFEDHFTNKEDLSEYLNNQESFKYFGECKTKEEAKMVYRKLTKLYHPDSTTGNEEKFRAVEEEYERYVKSF